MTSSRSALFRAFVIGTLLMACATPNRFKEHMDAWLGGNINRAIMQFGPPGTTYKLPNGMTMYSWLQVGGTVTTALYNPYLNVMTAGTHTPWCRISLAADSTGHIRAWQANGTACTDK